MYTNRHKQANISFYQGTLWGKSVKYVATWLASFQKLLSYTISQHALPYAEHDLHSFTSTMSDCS